MPTQLGVLASPPLLNVVSTDVDTQSPISSNFESAARDKKWREMIDYQLIEWGSDPSRLEDEEMPPVSRDTIQLAIRVAVRLRDKARLLRPESCLTHMAGSSSSERQGTCSSHIAFPQTGAWNTAGSKTVVWCNIGQ